jgi:signal transduction histidine kinase
VRNSLKLFQTSTFRLAALYLVLFALSVGALLGYVYLNTAVLLERQTDDTIRAEVQALADQYRLRGLTGIIDTVQRRSQEDTGSIYLLTDPSSARIAGNIDQLPPEAKNDSTNWIEFPVNVKRGGKVESHTARAFHTDLSGDYELVAGRDVEALRQFDALIRHTIYGTLGIALVLGLGIGLLLSRNLLRRVDAITDASRHIMDGNMAGRMPVSGSGDELDRLAQALNEMLDQIERLMAAMKEVSSNVAHDLKTPLTRIKARVESALRSGNANEYHEALDKTVEESDRLLQTFNSLLSIARAESGQSRAGFESVDAAAVLGDVAELYEPMAEEEGGKLTFAAAPGLMIRADRQLVAQAISNLIDNALKYGADDGQPPDIAVSGTIEDGHVVIAVCDHGPGIPAADRERVLERFVRLDASRSKPGNGLGLSLVAGVMKLHNGSLALEDNAPGLRVKLVLPLQHAAG